MKIKTSEAKDQVLNYLVARCLGGSVRLHTYRGEPADQALVIDWMHDWQELSEFSPSTDWSQGGPIIEREKIILDIWGDEWLATRIEDPAISEAIGPTPLIAAMRCYVASKLGDEVEVPDESST